MGTQSKDHEDHLSDRLVHAYERMLERAKQTLHGAAEGSVLHHTLEVSKEKAVELGELTREEAEKVGEYVLRDLHNAAQYLADEERELADWARLDLLLIETDLLNRFSLLVDRTKVELEKIRLDAAAFGEWHTGEVTGIGTLQCIQCAETIHFHKVSRIPPCPKCHSTVFRRVID
jgi:hypothetical protein